MDGRGSTLLIVAGVALALAGVLARYGVLAWFGHLPGDIRIERGGARVYAPIVSMLLISLVLSLASYVIRRWW